MGPSGSGKSTLLRILAGLQIPDQGRVSLNGRPLRSRNGGDARISLIHQDYRLVDFLTVAENLALAAELRAIDVSQTDVANALDRVGLNGLQERSPATLSGGEQQRVAIARALVSRSRVLLADEPTGALDGENTITVATLLRDISQEHQVAVVVATHDRSVAHMMSRALVHHDGSFRETSELPA
ncbi:ABC transporter ATP-binding protein [Actinoplanes sp. CA-051413]|uniref:ABC transporter ATP-binding protein n=1 Tax=Actinoplanes sp. CA-051413 TaxID=3239899 RepID=UPI003D958D4F